MPTLKVFRTSIGFHDAYVAAPSRAAALRAWGANTDLFAAGAAELIEDPKLTKAPLAQPGHVIRVSRGTISDHLGSLEDKTSRGQTKEGTQATKKARKPPPPPFRARLDVAEAKLSAADEAHNRAAKKVELQIEALRSQLDTAAKAFSPNRQKLEIAKEKAEADYQAAMEEWRSRL